MQTEACISTTAGFYSKTQRGAPPASLHLTGDGMAAVAFSSNRFPQRASSQSCEGSSAAKHLMCVNDGGTECVWFAER